MAETTNDLLIFLAYVTIISVFAMSMGLDIEINNETIGFTLDLIHRDSLQSPFYDPTLSSSQRVVNVLQRSLDRIHRFKNEIKYGDPPQTDIISYGTGEYLIKYSIGTPPVSTFAVADTGADLIWLQCQPCVKCFRQNIPGQNLPIFNPKSSSTYSKVPCDSNACRVFFGSHCDKNRITCLYKAKYLGGTNTEGVVSRETVTLSTSHGQNWSFPYIMFGCGHSNDGFDAHGSGIVGLNGGADSLIGQLDYLIQGKFSYCLVSLYHEITDSSKMNFGANAIVSGPGTVSTPFTTSRWQSPHYFLTLEGVSIIDGERLEFYDYSSNNSKFIKEGNIIIDSGSSYTYLRDDFYKPIKKRLEELIYFRQVSRKPFDLCYFLGKTRLLFQGMIFHFKGADVKLRFENIFIRVTDEIICCTILPARPNAPALLGNIAQRNFMVGYDLEKRTVSFKHTNCRSFP